MTNHESLFLWCSLLGAGVAATIDVRSRRVPNALTAPLAIAGLVLHLICGGAAGLASSALWGVGALAAFLPFYLAGGMGAGDVKLLGAVACMLAGVASFSFLLLGTVLSGAAMALGAAAYHGRLRHTLANVGALVAHHARRGLTAHPECNVKNEAALRIPYAVAIACGCVTSVIAATGAW